MYFVILKMPTGRVLIKTTNHIFKNIPIEILTIIKILLLFQFILGQYGSEPGLTRVTFNT
jgi:hypothetical protein